jgi:hypothetical protein
MQALLIAGFVLLGIGVATSDIHWSYAGLGVFAGGAIAYFVSAWRMGR